MSSHALPPCGKPEASNASSFSAWDSRTQRTRRPGVPSPPPSSSRLTNSAMLACVASRIFDKLSVLGQRGLPCLVVRLLLLKVVGSSPARLAKPDADRWFFAANISMPRQIALCVSIQGRLSPTLHRKSIFSLKTPVIRPILPERSLFRLSRDRLLLARAS